MCTLMLKQNSETKQNIHTHKCVLGKQLQGTPQMDDFSQMGTIVLSRNSTIII